MVGVSGMILSRRSSGGVRADPILAAKSTRPELVPVVVLALVVQSSISAFGLLFRGGGIDEGASECQILVN